MATFEIDDLDTGSSVTVNLVFNLVFANTWDTASGDGTILGFQKGEWQFSGAAGRLIMSGLNAGQLCFFTIRLVSSPTTDPFALVNPGDSGDALLLNSSDHASWTMISK